MFIAVIILAVLFGLMIPSAIRADIADQRRAAEAAARQTTEGGL